MLMTQKAQRKKPQNKRFARLAGGRGGGAPEFGFHVSRSGKYPEFLILRHGQTEWNSIGRMQGRLDSPLTEKGVAHAQAQFRILQDFGVSEFKWICSPKGRTRQTADIAAGPFRDQLQFDSRLVEIDIGDWTGAMLDELKANHPDHFTGEELDWYDRAPGGEGIAGLATRCEDFLKDQSEPAVIITHGMTSRVLRCLLMGMDVSEFGKVGGGQGVVHYLKNGECKLLR